MWCVWKCSNRYPSHFTHEIEVRDTRELLIGDAHVIAEVLATEHANSIGVKVSRGTSQFRFTTNNGTDVWYEVRKVA